MIDEWIWGNTNEPNPLDQFSQGLGAIQPRLRTTVLGRPRLERLGLPPRIG